MTFDWIAKTMTKRLEFKSPPTALFQKWGTKGGFMVTTKEINNLRGTSKDER
jgi:hypothetical protein